MTEPKGGVTEEVGRNKTSHLDDALQYCDRTLYPWLEGYGILPELRLAWKQAKALTQAAKASGRQRQEYLDQAVHDLIERYRRKGLVSKP